MRPKRKKSSIFFFFWNPFKKHHRVGKSSSSVAETSTWEAKHHTRRVGELRFITPAGPEELTLQALSPEQRGDRVFIHGQSWLSRFVGLQGLGRWQRAGQGWVRYALVSSILSLHFLRPTWSRLGKEQAELEAERAGSYVKILILPLQQYSYITSLESTRTWKVRAKSIWLIMRCQTGYHA